MMATLRHCALLGCSAIVMLAVPGRSSAAPCALPGPAKPNATNLAPNVVRLIRVADFPAQTGKALNASVRGPLRAANPTWGLERYCGLAAPKQPKEAWATCQGAAILIRPNGRIIYRGEKAAGSFCLEDDPSPGPVAGAGPAAPAPPRAKWGTSLIARIALSSDSDDEAYCGAIAPGQTYLYPEATAKTRGVSEANPIVAVRIWASWSDAEMEKPRKDALAAVTDLRDKYVQEWFFRRWAAAVYAHPTVDAAGLAALLDTTIGQATAEIQNGTGSFADLGKLLTAFEAIDRAPLVKAVKTAAGQVAATLPKADHDALCAYASELAATKDEVAAPAVLRSNLKIAGDGSDVPAVVLALGLANQPTSSPALPWPVFDGNLPGTSKGFTRTIALRSGDGRRKDKKALAFANDRVLVFGHDLARDQTTGDTTTKGDTIAYIKGDAIQSKASDLGTAVASLVRAVVAVSGLPAPAPPPAVRVAPIHAPCVAAAEPLCGAFDKQFNATNESDLPALPSGWRAPFTSTVLVPDTLEASRPYTTLVCRGVDTCDATTKSAAITASVDFSSQPSHPFISTVTELAGNWGGATPIGGWQLDPVVGTSDPSQLYRLTQHDTVTEHMTISQLLVAYPFHGCPHPWAQGIALGFGPTLFQGTDAELFKQWNGRLLFEPPFARGVTVSVGASARSIEVPHGVPEGTLLVGSMGKPPAIAHDDKWVWLFSAGVGIDLSILGDAWNSAGKAFSSDKGSDKEASE
jgi:hypothetical protein